MTVSDPEYFESSSPASIFRHTSDDFWFWCLTAGGRRHPGLTKILPRLPVPDLRNSLAGASENRSPEREFGFYLACKQALAGRGRALTPDTRLLDFGSGQGWVSRMFLKDIQPWHLISADTMNPAPDPDPAPGKSIAYLKIDPQPPLSLPDSSLDVVVSHAAFAHLSEADALAWVREFRRLLRPGGVALIGLLPREAAALAFPDSEAIRRAQAEGAFCHRPRSSASGLGDSLISPAYVRRMYASVFPPLEYLDAPRTGLRDCDLLVLQVPESSAPIAETAPTPAAPPDLPWTGERLVTSLRGPIAMEHLHRYAVAAELTAGKDVLDVASGEGYGSALLAERARRVIGVDVDPVSVAHAARKYSRPGLEFHEGRAELLPLEDAAVDAVVSFETIEHVQDQAAFLAEIRRCLRPGGLLIISSPDRENYRAHNPDPNPYHLQELGHEEFLNLLRGEFRHVVSARQRHLQGSFLAPDDPETPARLGHFTGDFAHSEFQDGVRRGIYSLAVCSDAPLAERIPFGIFESDLDFSPDFQKSLLDRFQRERPLVAQALAWREEVIGAASQDLEVAQAEARRLEAALAAAQAEQAREREALAAEQARVRELAQGLGAEQARTAELTRRLETARSEAAAIRHRLESSLGGLRARWQAGLTAWREERNRLATLRALPGLLRRALLRKIAAWRLGAGKVRAGGPAARVLAQGLESLLRRSHSRARWVSLVKSSGLFDAAYYRARHPEISASDPVRHYLSRGADLGWNPNPYFDTLDYLRRNPDVADQGWNPLVHFILLGADELRDPGPEFDTLYYLEANPDVAAAGVQAFPHWYFTGRTEGRAPKAPASSPAQTPAASEPRPEVCQPGEAGAECRLRKTGTPWRGRRVPETGGVKAIAFYLPQFHPIPENDAWWGAGFTEWENVARAQPLMPGHDQPHLPAELGFYDLRVPEVRQHQADLARAFGIHGFCYYYYWFNGRKLLERPLAEVLASGKPDFPFCICWANENWTRRWDGKDQEILIEQKHSLASDRDFLRDVLPLLQDPRYIRFGGKPVLLVYRADRLAAPRETAAAWREQAAAAGLPGLHLCAVESLGFGDPRARGFDALVEFPPNSYATADLTPATSGLPADFRGKIADYLEMRRHSLERPREAYPLHRTVMTPWDNTPRLQNRATIFTQAAPDHYRTWLEGLLGAAPRERESLLFINAWNEWGEGAHLEPDLRHGFEYLEATAEALEASPAARTAPPVEAATPEEAAPAAAVEGNGWVLVVHDAHKHGAQFHALAIAREFRRRRLPFNILLREGGDLEPEFARCAETFNLAAETRKYGSRDEALARLARCFAGRGLGRCLGNTVVTGDVTAVLRAAGLRVLTLVNELPTLVETYGLTAQARAAAMHSEVLVFPAEFVRRPFLAAYPSPEARAVIRPQGVLRPNPYLKRRAWARSEVGKRLGLLPDQRLVLTVGYGDLRKGPDLFGVVARQVLAQPGLGGTAFAWVGHMPPELEAWLRHDLRAAGIDDRVHLAGFQSDDALFFAAADIFLLTSREDPFPNVMLSAMEAGLPVVAFAGSGGAEEALRDGCGLLTPYLDTSAMAGAVADLLRDETARQDLGRRASARAGEHFGFPAYVDDLLALLAVARAGEGRS